MTRTTQGPCLIDLSDQVGVQIKDFNVLFTLGAVTFPLGNFIGKYKTTDKPFWDLSLQ